MARTKQSSKFLTWNVRKKLTVGKRYQEFLAPRLYLGYRRPANGGAGSWFARWQKDKTQYFQENLGIADDIQDDNGENILTYAQAQAKAVKWFQHKERQALDGEPIQTGLFTVADALVAYFKDGERRGMKGLDRARLSANAWILSTLGNVEVSKLTRKKIESWLDNVATSPRKLRSKKGQEQAYASPPSTDDEKRARKDSANRILTILKAALTFALDRQLTHVIDPCWQKVKPFRGTTSARIRFLQPEEQTRLVNVCSPEFKDLVKGALLTGCRYGELARLQCKDYNSNSEIPTLFIAESKSGKPRHIVLTTEGVALFDELTAKSQSPNDLIFRNNMKRKKRTDSNIEWQESDQRRYMQKACEAAGLEYISFHELRHSYASLLVNNKCPLPVVAQQLGHSDSRMVEKHYGHLVPSYVADMVRAAMPTLGIVESPKIHRLKLG